MTHKEKAAQNREAFFKSLNAAPISYDLFHEIALAASTWATESFCEGMDIANDIAHNYTPVMTATHDGTATIVEPANPDYGC